ncbi:MAG: hypothetical protein WBA89_14760 [Microcoleus sp.]|uniref:hypothetical protein n=1 Tax=Microcoleus sp. TaxID=44472 RepID=UPI003C75A469
MSLSIFSHRVVVWGRSKGYRGESGAPALGVSPFLRKAAAHNPPSKLNYLAQVNQSGLGCEGDRISDKLACI